jgi:tetratricopeptide (TPR) repeat protein
MMKNILLYSFILLSFAIFAQEKDFHLPKANSEFADKKYADAEAEYRISLSNNPKKSISAYNLGNAIYKQNNNSEALFSYENAIKNSTARPEKHSAFHNSGNIYMKEKNYSAAVEAYKNAMRNNPKDEETRYNFALAKKMLKNNPPKKDDKKDKKDKKKDKTSDCQNSPHLKTLHDWQRETGAGIPSGPNPNYDPNTKKRPREDR